MTKETKRAYINANAKQALLATDYESTYNVYLYYKELRPAALDPEIVHRFNDLQDIIENNTDISKEVIEEFEALTKKVEKKEQERALYYKNLRKYKDCMNNLLSRLVLRMVKGKYQNNSEVVSDKPLVEQIYNVYKEIGKPEDETPDNIEAYEKQLKIYADAVYYADLAAKAEARQNIARGSATSMA